MDIRGAKTQLARPRTQHNVLRAIQSSKLLCNLLRAIRRVVIHNNNFIVQVMHLKHAAQEKHNDWQIVFLVVRWQDDTSVMLATGSRGAHTCTNVPVLVCRAYNHTLCLIHDNDVDAQDLRSKANRSTT